MQATVQPKQDSRAGAASAPTLPDAKPLNAAQAKPEKYNPYLAGRREWDERYGDSHARAKKSDRIALICSSIALLIAPAFVVMALRPAKIVVVAVNSLGQYLGSGTSGQSVLATDEMKRSTVAEWVSNLRL